ncbi:hypothetical protein KUV65_08715 [Maritalea mobilis]|uniref:hypothetical protein n=1 Tax=Maritalea mobilis TaxID=483324 RepID=UPI001C974B9A|nr:hypothetical protein [Maritalea mobilis]MBY6201441.1 hypothetical protein [Maritalea mobilis]
MEQPKVIVPRINAAAGSAVLLETQAITPKAGRLPGIDSKARMSKPDGNAIALSASTEEIRSSVRAMFSEPDQPRVEGPGCIEGDVVFTYLAYRT